MLETIRKHMTGGFLALVVLGLIVLSFMFFGVAAPSFTGVNYAAKVNGVEIPLNQYRQQMQRVEAQYAQYFPDGIPDEQRAQLRENILDSLIREELIRQRIYDDRYIVGNDELLEQIKAIPQFQLNGVFDRTVYEQQLRIAGQSPGQFERDLKSSLSINQLRSALANSSFTIPQEIELKNTLENEQRKASFAIIPASKFKANVTVSDEDLLAEYETTKETLLTEEQVDIEYIELTAADLAKDVDASDEILASYYDEVSFRYGSAEERAARHILVSTEDGNEDERKAFAQSLLDQIKAGADLGELAKDNSDDVVSAANNGDLGLFGKGAMVAEFEAAAFSLDVGEVSDLVKTQYGFHIIEVTEIKPSNTPLFGELTDEQRKELEEEYRGLQVEGLLAERAEALADEVFDARDTLKEVAGANGLTVKTQNNLTRSSFAGIASNPEVKNAAFSDDLRDGTNSDMIAVSPEQAVFLRVVEYRDVEQKSFEDVKQSLKLKLEQEAAAKMASDKGIALQAELSSSDELKSKAEAEEFTFTEETLMTRNQAGVQGELLSAIFAAEKPQAGELVEQGVELSNGDYAIFYLSEVQQADSASLSDTEKQAASRSLAEQNGNNEMNAYLVSLREKADIEIPPEQEALNN